MFQITVERLPKQINKTYTDEIIKWSYPEKKPDLTLNDKVIVLMASGAELNVISKEFKNLPIKKTVTIWRNEMAQFVFDNL